MLKRYNFIWLFPWMALDIFASQYLFYEDELKTQLYTKQVIIRNDYFKLNL